MSLPVLCCNLQEIYSAAHDPKTLDPVLVPNLFGTRVYHASRGWGRLWKWFYHLISPFIGEDFKVKKLRQTMQKTQKLFQEHLDLIQDYVKTYQTYLQKKSVDESLDEKDFQKARKAITEWNHATTPFLNYIQSGGKKKISELFNKYCAPDLEEGKPIPLLPWEQNFETIQQLQKIIDLEGYLHEPLPLSILVKLTTQTELTNSDEKILENWIFKLNKLENKVKIGPFHDALKAFIYSLSLSKEQESPNLMNLELALLKKRLLFFEHEDPEHVQWKDTLQPGDRVYCNGKEIILGEQLGGKFYEEDHNVIFSIKDDPEKVILIGINRTILALKKRISDISGGGIPSAEYLEIDNDGRCAIIERLYGSLDRYQWNVEDWVTPEAQNIADPIAKAVKWMVQENVTPRNFSSTHLMFNKKGVLKSVKVYLLDKFDFIVLEDFLFTCSNGNRTIFIYMMDLSDLFSHRYQRFCEIMLRNGLDGIEKKATHVAALEKITDPKIIDRAQSLYDEAKKLKVSCCRHIFESYDVRDRKLLESNVTNAIVNCYTRGRAASRLWPTTETDAIASVIETMKLQKNER